MGSKDEDNQEPILTHITAEETCEWIECPDCKRVIKLFLNKGAFIEVIK